MGVQEARTDMGTKIQNGMLRLSSGHSNHNLGCELWVRLDTGPSSECRFLAKHFAITLAEPRCLVVA
eukprot:12937057-Prorocentrum_lima.AAC.1